jgi:hypothetical protein
MYRRKRRILKTLVLGFVVAAFAAPAALAEPRGSGNDPQVATATPAAGADDRALYRGTSPQLDQTIASSPRFNVIGSTMAVEPPKAVDLPRFNVVGSTLAVEPPKAVDLPRFNVVGSTLAVEPPKVAPTLSPAIRGEQVKTTDRPSFGPVSQPTVSVTTDDGFQWVDAGFGAASTLALVLLMGAAGLLIRHQRRRIAAY